MLSVLGLFPRLLSLLVLSNQSALAELLDDPFGELFTALTVLGFGEGGLFVLGFFVVVHCTQILAEFGK